MVVLTKKSNCIIKLYKSCGVCQSYFVLDIISLYFWEKITFCNFITAITTWTFNIVYVQQTQYQVLKYNFLWSSVMNKVVQHFWITQIQVFLLFRTLIIVFCSLNIDLREKLDEVRRVFISFLFHLTLRLNSVIVFKFGVKIILWFLIVLKREGWR